MRSHLEEQVADLLDEMKVPYQYEGEKLTYTIEAKYIPDFKVGDVYLETKGYFPPEQRRKMKAVKKAKRTRFRNRLRERLKCYMPWID